MRPPVLAFIPQELDAMQENAKSADGTFEGGGGGVYLVLTMPRCMCPKVRKCFSSSVQVKRVNRVN